MVYGGLPNELWKSGLPPPVSKTSILRREKGGFWKTEVWELNLLLWTYGGILGNLTCHPEAFKAPKEQPRRAQELEKRAQEGPKSPTRAVLHPNLRFIKNMRFTVVKWRFSRVRGSAWELEIGTERFQDKVNNVLGDDDEINQVKIHKCGKKRVPKTMYRI